jgi:rhamnulokinase
MAEARSPLLTAAASFLTMPDLFNFWLSGRRVNEFTNASTTQCFDPHKGDWARDLLAALGIPTAMFGEIVPPGTVLGRLQPAVAAEVQAPAIPVIAPATHDTGSAVAAVPMSGEPAIYLSSGTWSLMGVEVAAPVASEAALAHNFTNEGGVDGTFRLLKNIMGLWLLQECRRTWAASGDALSYADLADLAAAAMPFSGIILPNAARFLAPRAMPAEVTNFLAETGQPTPPDRGALLRTIFESLALEYRWVAERLDELAGRQHRVIHIIGGGAQNQLLNQLTADATGRTVLAGPVEATALGNALVQALALGHVGSLAEGRALVNCSFPVTRFEPQRDGRWQTAYARYLDLRAAYAEG